jgi:hypothetical protein
MFDAARSGKVLAHDRLPGPLGRAGDGNVEGPAPSSQRSTLRSRAARSVGDRSVFARSIVPCTDATRSAASARFALLAPQRAELRVGPVDARAPGGAHHRHTERARATRRGGCGSQFRSAIFAGMVRREGTGVPFVRKSPSARRATTSRTQRSTACVARSATRRLHNAATRETPASRVREIRTHGLKGGPVLSPMSFAPQGWKDRIYQ